jgi:integrase/recombinase XerD
MESKMPFLADGSASLYGPSGLRKYLTPSERERFIATALACRRPELRTFCLTLAYTGCRISEALALTAGGVEPQEFFIALRSLKRRRKVIVVREVPVPASLIAEIQKVHWQDETERELRLWTWSRSRAWQLVKSVMVEAGMAQGIHATPKGLRHAFGIHAVRSGIPLNLIQRWMGHASMKTTAIYLEAIGSEEREIAQRMWKRD